jgi:hypothetical protein
VLLSGLLLGPDADKFAIGAVLKLLPWALLRESAAFSYKYLSTVNLCKYSMRLSKAQQEVYDNLMLMLKKYGREYMFGWALGTLIRLSQHDPQLRREIKHKAQSDQ